jgi:hypothetical protein
VEISHKKYINNKTNMALKYDTIIIELQENGKASASISIRKVDLEILQNSHNVTRSQILEDMIQNMEKGKEENNEDSKQLELDL